MVDPDPGPSQAPFESVFRSRGLKIKQDISSKSFTNVTTNFEKLKNLSSSSFFVTSRTAFISAFIASWIQMRILYAVLDPGGLS